MYLYEWDAFVSSPVNVFMHAASGRTQAPSAKINNLLFPGQVLITWVHELFQVFAMLGKGFGYVRLTYNCITMCL